MPNAPAPSRRRGQDTRAPRGAREWPANEDGDDYGWENDGYGEESAGYQDDAGAIDPREQQRGGWRRFFGRR
jgi:hypothetical protein